MYLLSASWVPCTTPDTEVVVRLLLSESFHSKCLCGRGLGRTDNKEQLSERSIGINKTKKRERKAEGKVGTRLV